jgi:DnaK suppressor protein
MKKIRKQLEEQKAILVKRLKNEPVDEHKQPHRSRVPWRFSQKLRQTLLFALAGQQIEEVTDAMDRLDDGVYGVCVVCGEMIEPNRLEVLPTTTRCWDCQHQHH